jgi:hypothetical protein
MLIVAALCGLSPPLFAQDGEEGDPDRETLQRLGDQPVENEYELDVKVPPTRVQPPKPETDEERAAREAAERTAAVAQHLANAEKAFNERRIDQPPGDCAWFYYRSALDLDPGNPAAAEGLVRVQQDMIRRALEYARDLDFESAERLL